MTIARNTVEFASLIAGSCFGDAVTLRALEVNQGAQDWHNSKTLLQARETVVRAFVETPAGAPDQRVTGRLIGRRDGVELPGQPARGHQHVRQRAGAQRHRGPPRRDRRLAELRAAASSGPTRAATSSSSSTPAARRWTARSRPIRARRRATAWWRRRSRRRRSSRSRSTASTSTATRPNGATSSEQIARVQSALPVSTFNWSTRQVDYDDPPSIDDVNHDLHRMREVERTSCGDSCGYVRDIFYGLIDGGPPGRSERQGQRHPERRGDVGHQQPQRPDLDRLRPQHGRARDQPLARRAPRRRQRPRRERRLPVVGQAQDRPLRRGRRPPTLPGTTRSSRSPRASVRASARSTIPTTRSGASITASRAPTRTASASPTRSRRGR